MNEMSVALSTSAAIGYAVPTIRVIGYGPSSRVEDGPISHRRRSSGGAGGSVRRT